MANEGAKAETSLETNVLMNNQSDAYKLLHEGTLALAEIEHNGFRIDVEYLRNTKKEVTEQIRAIRNDLKSDPIYKKQLGRFGQKTKLTSRKQLAKVLSLDENINLPTTNKGNTKLDETALSNIDLPYCKKFLELDKLNTLNVKYIDGILREVQDEYLHTVFNLHLVRTFRSSSSNPNLQNIPIRNDEVAKLIRPAFIPRPGHVLVEVDYSGAEIRVAACYNHDPVLIEYINDPSKDMHRDMAAECYMCKAKQVSKKMRYCAKNQFVFPQFYGSFFKDCAPNLWDSIGKMDLRIDGMQLDDWLVEKGITGLGSIISHDNGRIETRPGTFLEHIRKVEEDFWGQRFKVYNQWKKDWYEQYLRTGKFRMLTGFEITGLYKRNEVINSPIQGSAFHCLLWSLIQIIKQIKRRKMKTKVVGQVHDSICLDCPINELEDIITLCTQVMTKDLLNEWDWLIVPMEVEVKTGDNWYEMKELA